MSEKTIARCLILIMLVAIFDSISTYVLSLQSGFCELNPIMELVLALKSPFLFFIIRIVPTTFLVFCIWVYRIPGKRIVPFGIVLLIIVHNALMIWHFIAWFNLLTKI